MGLRIGQRNRSDGTGTEKLTGIRSSWLYQSTYISWEDIGVIGNSRTSWSTLKDYFVRNIDSWNRVSVSYGGLEGSIGGKRTKNKKEMEC